MSILKIDEQIVNETRDLKAGEHLLYNLVAFKEINAFDIVLNLENNAVLDMNFADFGNWEGKVHLTINLNGDGAKFRFHCASYVKGSAKKFISVDVNHNVGHTESLVSCYGIACCLSQIHFDGCSFIRKGAIASKTRQEAKAILFDEKSQGFCSPVLKIDDNDVLASHAASVGRVNDDHLFYLLSRGLDKAMARKIITLGYLRPIVNHFEGEEMKQRLLSFIEETI